MNINNLSIRQFLDKYESGAFDIIDRDIQIAAGWYDWSCEDYELAGRLKKLVAKLKEVVESPKIDQDKHYVFFKNNYPFDGDLYDDFRITDMRTGAIIFTVVPATGHNGKKGNAEVWGKANKFKGPLVEGPWEDVKSFFKGEPK